MTKVKIKIFKAVDKPDLTKQIFLQHENRLARSNIKITSLSKEYLSSSDTILICAIDISNNEILGSIRIQFHNNINPLPLEAGIKTFDPTISTYIANLAKNHTVVESCGLWCVKGKVVRNLSIAFRLYTLSIALCRYLKIEYCLGFVPKHTLNSCIKAGFQFCEAYPEAFQYPSKKFSSYVLESHPLENNKLEKNTQVYSDSFNEDPNFTEIVNIDNTDYIIQHEILL